MSKDSFAKKHLEKYGWRNGQGLGKQESGMIDPIKPKLKFDTAGIGHDAGEQFSFHWWDHVFNKAAKNIQVQNCEDGVEVKQKGVKTKLISNKKTTSTVKEKSLLYGSFVKHGTLKPDGLISRDDAPTSSSSDDSDDEDCPPVSYEGNDEKLYKACGGRTAHKGARHGLHLSGKLRRIEEQDRIENEVLQRSAEQQQQTIEKRRKKKRDWEEGGGDGLVQKEEGGAEEVENGPHPGVESRNGGNLLGHEIEKPKGKKSKKRGSENAEKCHNRDIEDVTIHVKKSKKKKKKKVVEQDATAEESDSNELEGKTRRIDKSTESSKEFHKDCEEQDASGNDDRKRTKSKKRNKKMKGEREEVAPGTESGPVTAGDMRSSGDCNAISSSRIPELDDDMKNCSQEKKKKKKKRKNVEAEDDSSSSDSRKASHTKELDLEREDGDGSKNRKKRKHQTEERLDDVDEGGAIPVQVNSVSEQQGSKKSKKSKKKKSKERRD